MGRVFGKLFRVAITLVGVLIIALLGGVYVLLETQRGHDFLLEKGLAFANGEINGEISVGSVHSAGILRGLTLVDVALTGPDGSAFVRADSVRAGYSLYGFLRGNIIVSPAEVWSPRVLLEKLPGEDLFNVEKIFPPSDDIDPAPPGERRIAVERVQLHDGEVIIRMPVEEGQEPMERARIEEGPDGVLLQHYAFTAIEGDIPQILIQEPNAEGEYFRIQSLSLMAGVLDEPFEITDLRGRVERVDTRLSFDADRIWLTNSEFAGEGWIDWGAEVLALDLDLDADVFHLADLHWLDPELPSITGRLSVRTTGLLDEGLWTVTDADLELDGSRVRGSGGVQLGEHLRLVNVDLTADPLALYELERFLPEPLPISGWLRGRLRADGPLAELSVDGQLTLAEAGEVRPPTSATFAGLLHLDDDFGATELSLLLDPFHFGVAAAFEPAIPLRGRGTIAVEATGRLGSGVTFTADIAHSPSDLPHSRVRARGSVTGNLGEPNGALAVDIEGELDPVSLEMVARYYPEVPFSGVAEGLFSLQGPLSDLEVAVRMETPGGPVVADARFDAFDPGAHYRVEAAVEDFDVSRIMAGTPEPARFSGNAYIDGRGFDPESMWATARVEVGAGRLGYLAVDSVATFVRVENGFVTFDTILVQTSVLNAAGAGTLAFAEGAPSGEVRLAFESESLESLRPFLRGENELAEGTLSEIEVELDVVETDEVGLPEEDELTVSGRLSGEAVLSGSLQNFRTDGALLLEELVYGENSLREAQVTFSADDLRTPGWEVRSELEAQALQVFGRSYQGVHVEADYGARDEERGEGHAFVRIQRDASEDYRARAAFEIGAEGGTVNLDEFTLRFDAVQWNLGAPSIIGWSDEAVTVRDLRLIRPGIGGMRIEADGTIPFDGEIDFRLMVESLNLARIAQLAQTDVEVEGILSMGLEVTGQTRDPVMSGRILASDLRYDEFFLSSLEGDLSYVDRRVSGEMEAFQDGRQVFTLTGNAPLDLAFEDIENRLLDAPMELSIRIDAFPAANALSFLEDMQDVEGLLSGQVDIRGTPRAPSPTGAIQLRSGAATLPNLGVRYTGLQANMLLEADGNVLVNAEAQSRGTARVEGTIRLDPVSDPGFDLLIVTNNFLAVDRRDMNARMGGEVTLGGSYTRPLLRGDVRLEQATLFLDEFVRAADVIDLNLSDPSFFDVVDTTLVAQRPAIDLEARNPFMQNLQVDVNLVVARDTWLRSREINVEIGGQLAVNFNSATNEVVLSGSLQAVRGAYTAFGRQFQVRAGTVDFVGTPGIDPNLNIQAVNRLRTEGGEPLEIIATVEGNLTSPRVQLSSDSQPPIAESDLVSYLIFGRPSYALASGERSVLQGTAGAVQTFGAGALATQLGSIFAQNLPVDYFAVTQADRGPEGDSDRGIGGAFAATQVEVGRYFFDDLFVAVLYRPPIGGQVQSFPGARAEWRFTDLWTVESFIEDRFSRAGVSGFNELGIRLSRVMGFSIFREWGY